MQKNQIDNQNIENSLKSNSKYSNIEIKKLPEQTIEITGEISVSVMDSKREKAISKFKERVTIPGFRTGHAPADKIIQTVGEIAIMEEAAEEALAEVYPEIISYHKIDVIGRPEVTLTKVAPHNPLAFKITSSLAPEISLSDYKKTAKSIMSKKAETTEVADKEIDDTILQIRKNIAHDKMHEKEALGPDNHSHGEIKDEDLPEVNDEFASHIGKFKNVDEMKKAIKENLTKEKETKAKDKKRTDILEEIMKDSTIEMPRIIIDGELEKMLAQFKDDIANSNIDYAEYLTYIKKTEDDLKKEWEETAVKRAKSQIVLNKISRDEGLVPAEETVKKEMEVILSHYKDADRFRVRMYVESFLTNEMVFQFLEGSGEKTDK